MEKLKKVHSVLVLIWAFNSLMWLYKKEYWLGIIFAILAFGDIIIAKRNPDMF